MRRYEATPAASSAGWIVAVEKEGRDGDVIGVHLSEAEAKIIAFALNAITDGHALLAADRELLWGDVGEDHGAAVYVGPTEGVAP